MAPRDTYMAVAWLRSAYTVLTDANGLMDGRLNLCNCYSIRFRAAHDARPVALGFEHGVDKLLTLNVSDVRRFRELPCEEPPRLEPQD